MGDGAENKRRAYGQNVREYGYILRRTRHCLSRMRGGVQRQTYVAAAHPGAKLSNLREARLGTTLAGVREGETWNLKFGLSSGR